LVVAPPSQVIVASIVEASRDGHDDLCDQRAQKELAVALAGAGRLEDRA
jgi:hypothetical protein